MSGVLDNSRIEFACPKCGKAHSETIGRLRRSPRVHCQRCGTWIDIDASQFDSEMRQVDRSFDQLKRELDKLNRSLRF